MDRLSWNVGNYLSTLRNIPEEADFIYTAAEAWRHAWRGFIYIHLGRSGKAARFWTDSYQALAIFNRPFTCDISGLQMGPICCPETSVSSYQHTLRNIPVRAKTFPQLTVECSFNFLLLFWDVWTSLLSDTKFRIFSLASPMWFSHELLITLLQGRIKLFGAPRQWKHFRPLFQAVFLSGGVITPQTVKHHASQSQDRNNKYFILYIEFCFNNKI